MKLTSVGEVIATRSIRREGSEATYLIKIGLPRKFPDSTDYYCPVQVASDTDESSSVLFSAGIDSVQALQLAMKLIGAILERLNQETGGELRWDGDENGNLGFPIPN